MHGEDQHFRTRVRGKDLAGCLHAVKLWHGKVHNDDVGAQLACHGHRLAASAGLAADFPPVLAFDRDAQPLAHHFVVIGEENAQPAHSEVRA